MMLTEKVLTLRHRIDMFISTFKNNQTLSIIILSVILLAVWLPGIGNQSPLSYNNTMPLYEFYARAVNNVPYMHNSLALILIILESVMLHFEQIRNNGKKNSDACYFLLSAHELLQALDTFLSAYFYKLFYPACIT
jgi:hypothetical protein